MDITETLTHIIKTKNFEAGLQLYLETADKEDIEEALEEISFETEDKNVYHFLEFLIEKCPQEADLHFWASKILVNDLEEQIEYAIGLAFEHCESALALKPNYLPYLEHKLCFSTMPEDDPFLDEEETLEIIERIRKQDPKNETASEYEELLSEE